MTTGEKLSLNSPLSNVSALSHLASIAMTPIAMTPIENITIDISQVALDASVTYITYSADIEQSVIDAYLNDEGLEANVSQITLEGNL